MSTLVLKDVSFNLNIFLTQINIHDYIEYAYARIHLSLWLKVIEIQPELPKGKIKEGRLFIESSVEFHRNEEPNLSTVGSGLFRA